ncbi:phage holin family protein [Serratia fonticola]|uniref:phage holin family protein n=1 Tax=Serratia fonticola TaxID=47917 RepID=UPI0015C5A8A3|nr:phage holin family protein [Serratia fonticola]NYA15742.1 phage holin family protein [Serratia fonticola]NYA35862.1 phage holin family protein [Serratia fonticola]
MTLHEITRDPETLINAVICTLIFLRLFSFRRNGAKFVPWASVLAVILMIVSGSITIRIALGAYEGTTDPSELVLNTIICILVWRAKGNVVQLFKVDRGNSDA